MVLTEQPSGAAQQLLRARRSGELLPSLSADVRPRDNAAAWTVQNQVTQRLAANGDGVVGWKCAMPTAGKWVAAPIYRTTLYRAANVATVIHGERNVGIAAEPELAFVLGRDLPMSPEAPGPTEIEECIAAVHIALEIVGSRYQDPSRVTFPELLADGLFNRGLVLGAELVGGIRSIPPSLDLTIDSAGERACHRCAIHPEGDALRPLYWLVNFLHERGLRLHAGEAIITGSYIAAVPVPFGRTVHIDFGHFGSIGVKLDY